jgi:hypothetical protein
MEKRRAEEAESYNRKAKHVPYEEGDMVYTRVPKKERTKREPKWEGPLRVTRRKVAHMVALEPHMCVKNQMAHHVRETTSN